MVFFTTFEIDGGGAVEGKSGECWLCGKPILTTEVMKSMPIIGAPVHTACCETELERRISPPHKD